MPPLSNLLEAAGSPAQGGKRFPLAACFNWPVISACVVTCNQLKATGFCGVLRMGGGRRAGKLCRNALEEQKPCIQGPNCSTNSQSPGGISKSQ